MATIKNCDGCGAECYWEKSSLGKWCLMDSETDEPHWKSCAAKGERGQFNPVLKVKRTEPLKDLSTMAIIGALEQRIKKLEDKVYGRG